MAFSRGLKSANVVDLKTASSQEKADKTNQESLACKLRLGKGI
jgi:hypothetical protein